MIEEEEKKTIESIDKVTTSPSRAGSRGKGLMPNIKVVSQHSAHKKTSSLDLVIDFEETYNPLGQSQRSARGTQPAKPVAIVDEEDPDAGSDDETDNRP